MVMMLCMFLVAVAVAVAMVYVTWHVLAKAGEAGWKCLIPVLGPYTMTCIACEDKRVRIASLVSNILMVSSITLFPAMSILAAGAYSRVFGFSIFGAGLVTELLMTICFVGMFAGTVINGLTNYLLVTAFDESRGLGVCCVMFPFLVYAVFALDDDVSYGGAIEFGGGTSSGTVNFAK